MVIFERLFIVVALSLGVGCGRTVDIEEAGGPPPDVAFSCPHDFDNPDAGAERCHSATQFCVLRFSGVMGQPNQGFCVPLPDGCVPDSCDCFTADGGLPGWSCHGYVDCRNDDGGITVQAPSQCN